MNKRKEKRYHAALEAQDRIEGKDLKAFRKENGLIQREAAQLFGVHPISLSKFENGHEAIPPAIRLVVVLYPFYKVRQ